jgi:two-component system LytT family response regulator
VTSLRVVVADDEVMARRGLKRLLLAEPDVAEVIECVDGREAVEAIRRGRPDLVVLDVRMPELDGFGVIRELGLHEMPPVVFVTAYDRFAVRAFEVHALDYLVKPFSNARFVDTIERARRRLAEGTTSELRTRVAAAARDHESALLEPGALTRFVVRLGPRMAFISVEDVDWIEAQDYYALLHVGRQAHLVRSSLHVLEARLAAKGFVRVSRSAIVNMSRVRDLGPNRDGQLVARLRGGVELLVSRRRRRALVASTA